MNKKAIIAIVLAAVIIIGAGAGFVISRNKKPEVTTKAQSVSVSEQSTSQGGSTTESTTAETSSTTETTTEAGSTPYSFLYEGYWYFYNDEATSAFAISFKDEDDLEIAYFDEYNVMGEDPKFFKGDADYKIADGKIVVEDIPDVLGFENVILDINGETIKYGEIEFEHFDDLSLEHAYNHFN